MVDLKDPPLMDINLLNIPLISIKGRNKIGSLVEFSKKPVLSNENQIQNQIQKPIEKMILILY